MNKLAIVTALITSLTATVGAYAGAPPLRNPVNIFTANGSSLASGTFDAARHSSDSVQYIGCSMATDTVSSEYVSCFARNSSGATAYCYSSSPTLATIEALAGVNRTSYIFFKLNTTTGKCTEITINDQSTNL